MLSTLEKKHIRTLNLVLVILLGVSLGYLFSSAAGLYLNRQVLPTEAPSGRKSTHIRQPTLQTYEPILAYNLFDPVGRNKPGLGVSNEGSQKRQETTTQRADMILLGTVISSNRPFAVIQLKGQEQIFRLDEEIPGAGKLEGITREEVRVRHQDGTLFTLALPKGMAPDSGRRLSTSAPPSAGIKEVGENRWVISSQEASKARENMSEIFKQARLEARKVNGQVEGFTVKMIRPRTLLWKLGLKRGDLIKEINGVQLDSDEKVLEIYQQLKEARNISIGLQRRGKNLTFAYEVE